MEVWIGDTLCLKIISSKNDKFMPLFLVHTSKWWPCDMWPADLVTSRPFHNTLAAITFQIFIEVCMSDTFCIKIISRKRNYPQLLEINMWKWWPCDIGCNFFQTDLWIKFELVILGVCKSFKAKMKSLCHFVWYIF